MGTAVQNTLLDLQEHGGESAIGLAVTVAGAAAGTGLFGSRIAQDRDVDTPEVVAVAMGPLNDQHFHTGHIHIFIPQGIVSAAHALEPQAVSACLELGDDSTQLIKVLLYVSTQVACQSLAADSLVDGNGGGLPWPCP